MKKRRSNIILKSAVIVTLVALLSTLTGIHSNRKGIIENAAALEILSSRSKCYSQYVVTENSKCLECISCSFVFGAGITVGGYCNSKDIEIPGTAQ